VFVQHVEQEEEPIPDGLLSASVEKRKNQCRWNRVEKINQKPIVFHPLHKDDAEQPHNNSQKAFADLFARD
jgi:hypothetical protein